jgi:hypothetical protein
MYGEQADMIEGHFNDDVSPENMVALDFSKKIIAGLGAVILYGEFSLDENGVVGSKLVCRQQNEINKIFSIIESPPAYLISMGVAIFTDDQTLDRYGFDNIGDVSEVIGLDIERKKEK